MTRIVVLDDYQEIAHRHADWGSLPDCEVDFVHEHIGDVVALVGHLRGAEVVVAMRERTAFPGALLQQLGDLRLLVTTGAKNASIDMGAARDLGVTVVGTDSLPHPTAEHTLALILSLARHIPQEDSALRDGRWQTSLGLALNGQRLGIIGLGRLGTQVARLGTAFGMQVVAWSQNLTTERADQVGVSAVSKHELLATSRFVTLHLKVGDRTRDIIGAEDFTAMRPEAHLINTSRAVLVDQAALIDALTSRQIAGAAIDVYEDEPLRAGHPLLSAPNTVLTPHLGYVVEQGYDLYFSQAVEDIRAFLYNAPIRILNG